MCEFFEDKLRAPHTQVNPLEGHRWAQLLSQQMSKEGCLSTQKASILYEQFKNATCEYTNYHGQICGGHSVIRSFNEDPDSTGLRPSHTHIFIGCDHWQPKERHLKHIIGNYDPVSLLKLWGRDHCRVHTEILDDLGFTWASTEELEQSMMPKMNKLT